MLNTLQTLHVKHPGPAIHLFWLHRLVKVAYTLALKEMIVISIYLSGNKTLGLDSAVRASLLSALVQRYTYR